MFESTQITLYYPSLQTIQVVFYYLSLWSISGLVSLSVFPFVSCVSGAIDEFDIDCDYPLFKQITTALALGPIMLYLLYHSARFDWDGYYKERERQINEDL